MRARLDRVCTNVDFHMLYPALDVYHLSTIYSDHMPIFVSLESKKNLWSRNSRNNAGNFKFEYMWTAESECEKIITESWGQNTGLADSVENFLKKAEHCKSRLETWSKTRFGNVQKEIKRLREEIDKLKSADNDDSTTQRPSLLYEELEKRLDQEDKFWRQRSKEHWLREGDRNTNFFHGKASDKQRKKFIAGLNDENGNWCEERMQIEKIVLEHFGRIFMSSNPAPDLVSFVVSRMRLKLKDEIKMKLAEPFTVNDIDTAPKEMSPLKAPGPDGLPPLFFQKYWSILRNDDAVDSGLISGIKVGYSGLKISHLQFADDTLVFGKATIEEAENFLKILRLYCDASGQQVNLAKSTIVFSPNTSIEVRETIKSTLGVREVDAHDKYLGLPTVVGRSKKQMFANLRDKVGSKIQGWSEKMLSKAGKEVLIKAVLQALPSYAMSCFCLPESIIKEIQSMIGEYWWRNKEHGKPIHWTSWEHLCKSKKDGGLGFWDLRAFNMALMGKRVWRLLSRPDTLFYKVYKARYFPETSVLRAQLGGTPSLTWRCILKARDELKAGFGWRIGNGNDAHILLESWVPLTGSLRPIYTADGFSVEDHVRVLMFEDRKEWNEDLVRASFPTEVANGILSIPLSLVHENDFPCWLHTSNLCYNVKSAYHFLCNQWNSSRPGCSNMPNIVPSGIRWMKIWNLDVAGKVKLFIWRLLKNGLPVSRNLSKRGIQVDGKCVLCWDDDDSLMHLFLKCPVAIQIWALTFMPVKFTAETGDDVVSWFINCLHSYDSEVLEKLVVMMWFLWNARNMKIFEGKYAQPLVIARLGLRFWHDYKIVNGRHTEMERELSCCSIRWNPPPAGFMKLNFDATFDKDQEYGGIGLVIRNSDGHFFAARTIHAATRGRPEEMEALALWYAANWIKELDIRRVQVEGDALNVISQMNNPKENRSIMATFIAEAKIILDELESCKVMWTKR